MLGRLDLKKKKNHPNRKYSLGTYFKKKTKNPQEFLCFLFYFAFRNGSSQIGKIWLYSGWSYIASWSNYSWWNQWYYYIVYQILYGRKKRAIKIILQKLNEWVFVAEVTIPVALLGAEIDKYFPVEEFKHIGSILSAKPEVRTCLVVNFPLLNYHLHKQYKGLVKFMNSILPVEVKFVEYGRLRAWWRYFQVLVMVGHWGIILMMNLLLSLQKKLNQTCSTG